MNVAIAQSDVATAYGWGLDALWNGLLSGTTAIRATNRFAERGFMSDQAAVICDLRPGEGESRAWAGLKRILSPIAGKFDPMTPVILATTAGEIEYVERAILERDATMLRQSHPRFLLERVKGLLGLRGGGVTMSSACASSAAALTRAASMVRGGEAASVLVVTCDCVSEFVYSGFSTLLSLCAGPARPFDRDRAGLTLGEAFGWALVTSGRGGLSILGWGNTTDAVHMTAPDRTAAGLLRAIAKSCAMAGRPADEVALIAAHGTATSYSDAMEMVAFRAAMGRPRPVFSVKGGVGHTLAPAGLVQILVAGRAMALGVAPPTVGLTSPDDAAAGWVHGDAAPIVGRLALSTNSGFGGVNTAILLGGEDAL
ncbi:MAG: beta-ketoacyl synthase N-terminal-like domain-containing protein [Tepidisphaeraceae bacterium]|jgi:3-oxoacyl-[acyl-carrier-protein] synthase II